MTLVNGQHIQEIKKGGRGGCLITKVVFDFGQFSRLVCIDVSIAVLECRPTWSKSCLPVVVDWMANSSSASIVVTRTLTCGEQTYAVTLAGVLAQGLKKRA